MGAEIRNLPASAHMTPVMALDSVRRDFPEAADLIVIGYDNDGSFFSRSSYMTRRDALWLSEQLRKWALGE